MTSNSKLDLLCKQARQSFRSGDYSVANDLFTQVLAIDPDNTAAQDGAGTACFLLNRFEEAIEHFSRLSLLKPRDGKPYVNLGAVYNRIGEHQKAANALQKGIQRESKSSEGFYNLGIAHRGLNQSQMAINAYRKAIQLDPQMAAAHQNLANVYLETGKQEQAITHYKKALEIQPDFERAKRGLAQAEQASVVTRESSPFGRLVDTDALASNRTTTGSQVLSPHQREQDRRTIAAVTSEAYESAEELLEHLKEQVEPYLLALNKTVSEGTHGSKTIFSAHERFRDSLRQCTQLRTRLHDKLAELREHQEKMNTLGMD